MRTVGHLHLQIPDCRCKIQGCGGLTVYLFVLELNDTSIEKVSLIIREKTVEREDTDWMTFRPT